MKYLLVFLFLFSINSNFQAKEIDINTLNEDYKTIEELELVLEEKLEQGLSPKAKEAILRKWKENNIMEYIELVVGFVGLITISILLLLGFIYFVCWLIKKYFKKDLMPKDERTYEITELIFKYTGYTLFFTLLAYFTLDLIILFIF
tara:strand:- start:49 stop:489 length:441 start_codon:yes stop_codon:yes gene_type:complete